MESHPLLTESKIREFPGSFQMKNLKKKPETGLFHAKVTALSLFRYNHRE